MCGRVRHTVGVGRLAACWSCPEPEADVPRLAGVAVACLAEQNLGAGVQVVRRDPSVIAEVATDDPRVEVDDPGMFDERQQEPLRPGEREGGLTELPEQLQVLCTCAPDRADDRRDM